MSLLNTKQALQEKHKMQIKKTVKILSKEIKRLKRNVKIVVPLRHLSNFWRTLDMPFINCEVSLTLAWSENCVLADITTQAAVAALENNPARPAINALTNATFKITNTICIYQWLLYRLKMIRNSWDNLEQDLKEQLNGINIG